MKVRILLLGHGLIFLSSMTAFAQEDHSMAGMGRNPPYQYDPFNSIHIMEEEAEWSGYGNTQRPNQLPESATVSLQQLAHKIPKQAMKEFSKGMRAFNKGDNDVAMECFQNALKIDPEFADAQNDLGVIIAKQGHMDTAALQFQRVIHLIPDHRMALANLSVALYNLQRYHEASEAARRALRVDPSLLKTRYVLALSLIAEHGDTIEALDNLKRAATKFPEARLTASNVLAGIGRLDDAARQLEEYLRSSTKGQVNRQEIEARLAELRQ